MYNIQEEITKQAIDNLIDRTEKLFVEALELKGFKFENKADFIYFITNNCRCEDNIDIKQKIYFVNNTPFFLHNYQPIFDSFNFKEPFIMTANYGTYKFI